VDSGTAGSRAAADVRGRLQQALRAALQARDQAAVSALRSAQAAIGNAEAVPPPPGSPAAARNEHFAGAIEGPGAAEAPRRMLTEEQASEIVRTEVAERLEAAELYDGSGHAERAVRLRREADALAAVLAGF
jgi:uncharacterized protein